MRPLVGIRESTCFLNYCFKHVDRLACSKCCIFLHVRNARNVRHSNVWREFGYDLGQEGRRKEAGIKIMRPLLGNCKSCIIHCCLTSAILLYLSWGAPPP